MTRGAERIEWMTAALQGAGLDALVCTLPANILMLSGYWPVVGSTAAVATRDGHVAVLAPEDEREPAERQRRMYQAVFAARAAALAAIRPGVRAAEVDRAARDELTARGFGAEFTHGVGHNVGFSAISMEFPPRLHPASDDRPAIGMTFNIEPAIYIRGYGGLRHCDVVTVTAEGGEVLTPFHADMELLTAANG